MLYPMFSGLENLDYFSRLAGCRYPETQLFDFLNRTGLPKAIARRRVETYSKGMRQKVGLAIALAKQAKVLLLDEPTSGLDPAASYEFSALVTQIAGNGAAVLMATHDLFRVKETGTRAGIMKLGKLMTTVDTANLNSADLEQMYLHYMRFDHLDTQEVA
jgi:ABC-2 type transport system ATP-binding protein